MERKVTVIPPTISRKRTRVVIYCRVSTNSDAQMHSLSNQLEFLTASVTNNLEWELVNVYIDIKSGANSAGRYDLQRMLSDARAHKFDMLLIKSCSRFSRSVIDGLSILHELVDLGIQVRFDADDLCSTDENFWSYVTTHEALAEQYNIEKSESIKNGIRQSAKSGESRIFDRKCYGYKHDDGGNLIIDPEQAEVVRLIFKLYLSGYSVLKIIRELQTRGIPSPTGKETWYKRSIETMLTNIKYVGNSFALQTSTQWYPTKKAVPTESILFIEDNHEGIISKEDFAAVQLEREQRSNVTQDQYGNRKRSSTRYSSKKIKE